MNVLIILALIFGLVSCSGKNYIVQDKIQIDNAMIEVRAPSSSRVNSWNNNSYPEHLYVKNLDNKNLQKIKIRGKIISPPVVADNKIYVLTSKNKIIAYDLSNFQVLWEVSLGSDINENAKLTCKEGKIYINTGYRELLALDSLTGQRIWYKTFNDLVFYAPLILDNGNIIVQTMGDSLYAIDYTNGKFLWHYKTMPEMLVIQADFSPILYKNTIISGFSSGELISVDLSTGNPLWQATHVEQSDTISDLSVLNIISQPIIDNNHGYFAVNNKIFKIDLDTGEFIWKKPIVDIQNLTKIGNILIATTHNKQIVSLDTATGDIIWINNLVVSKKDSIIGFLLPLFINNNLFITTVDGDCYKLNIANGEIIESFNVKPKIVSTFIANDELYLVKQSELLRFRSISKEGY